MDTISDMAFKEMQEIGAVDVIINRKQEPESRSKAYIEIMLNIRKSLLLQFQDVPEIENAFAAYGSPQRRLIVFFSHKDFDAAEVRRAADREKRGNRFFLVRHKQGRKERESRLAKQLEEELTWGDHIPGTKIEPKDTAKEECKMTELEKLHTIMGWRKFEKGKGDLITIAKIEVTDAEATAKNLLDQLPPEYRIPEIMSQGYAAMGGYLRQVFKYDELKKRIEDAVEATVAREGD